MCPSSANVSFTAFSTSPRSYLKSANEMPIVKTLIMRVILLICAMPNFAQFRSASAHTGPRKHGRLLFLAYSSQSLTVSPTPFSFMNAWISCFEFWWQRGNIHHFHAQVVDESTIIPPSGEHFVDVADDGFRVKSRQQIHVINVG